MAEDALAVAGGDAGAFLAAMLQGVQAQVGVLSGSLDAENAEQAAVVPRLVGGAELACECHAALEQSAHQGGRLTVNYLTATCTFRCRGPSNSQKYTACHVPRTGRPPETIRVTDGPTRLVLMWAAEFPSEWR